MLIVSIHLMSARTGKLTELGRMHISNDGASVDPKRGNYDVEVMRKGTKATPQRRARVENYPRLAYNVWRLVLRAPARAFPEEQL